MPDNYGQVLATTAVASGTASVAAIAATANLRLLGMSAKENAGTPGTAEFILHNSSTNNAPVLFVKLAASESIRDFFTPTGIDFSSGIYVERISGTTQISLFTKQ